MKNNNFQIVVIIIFIAAAIFSVFVFSGAIPIGKNTANVGQGTVVMWGTFSSIAMTPLIENFNNVNKNFVVQYVEKNKETFNQDLLEALAGGVGPDLLLLPDNLALSYNNKIFTIPYTSYPLVSFKNNFVSAGEVFLTSKGILAFPLAIDPLMMYYNRSMLDANSIVYPPKTWNDLVDMVPTLTKKDELNKIIKSTVAMGQFSNINHAKDILATLFMQTGNPIVIEKDGYFSSVLAGNSSKYDLGPVLKFYTDFADSLTNVYSWNRSMPSSMDAFSKEDLVFYFGFASELPSLVNKNPNQNFLIAPMPQIKNASSKLTSANVTGIAISSFSKNFNTAYIAAGLMSSGEFASSFAQTFNIAPARRDLLSQKPNDAYSPIFYDSALYARSWLDPSPKNSDEIFRGMIDKVISNSMQPSDALGDASAKFDLLLR